MTTLSTVTLLLTHSLAWALLHSLWQGALLFGTFHVLFKAMPGAGARIKYNLSIVSLLSAFTWFINTWQQQYYKLKEVAIALASASKSNTYTTYTVHTTDSVAAPHLLWSNWQPAIEQYVPFIIIVYSIGLLFMLVRFSINIIAVGRLRKKGLIAPGSEWDNMLAHLQKQLNIVRPVQLFLSANVKVPVMLGILKPIILLPIATISYLSTEQVEAILLHELAHIRRHDYLLNMIQAIIETILFFNPFVWLMSAIARREREHCCDDIVVAGAASALPYAQALAILEGARINNHLALAATGRKKQLFHRIKRIMEMKNTNINYSRLTIIAVALVAITFAIAMATFTPSFAQKAKAAKVETTPASGNSKPVITTDSTAERKETPDQPEKTEVPEAPEAKERPEISTVVMDTLNIEQIVKNAMAQAQQAVANINTKEIQFAMTQAQEAVNNIDWNEMRAEIDKGIAEVNKSLNDPSITAEIKKELENAHIELEDTKRELSGKQQEIAEKVKEEDEYTAKHKVILRDGDGATVNTDQYKAMLAKMDHEGLLDGTKKFKVSKENGDLYINGKRQSGEVYSQYQHYFNNKKVLLKGPLDDLTITIKN